MPLTVRRKSEFHVVQVQRPIHGGSLGVHLLRPGPRELSLSLLPHFLSPSLLPLICRYPGPPTSPLFVRAGTLTAYARSSPLFGDPRSRVVINSLRCYFFALFLLLLLRTRGPPYSTDSFSSPYIPSPRLHCAASPLKGTFMRPRGLHQGMHRHSTVSPPTSLTFCHPRWLLYLKLSFDDASIRILFGPQLSKQ